MSMKEKLKELISGLMALEENLPEGEMSEGEGMELPGKETEIEIKMESDGMESENEMPESDPLMEHMKRALGRNRGEGMASKPMFASKEAPMTMKKPEMPMQRRFGK